MLGEVCYWIFNMSISASLMGLIVLLIRKLQFIPHRISVILWIVPFFRMCIPLGLNSPYSLMTLITRLTAKTITVYQPADDISLSASNFIMAADSYFPITYKHYALEGVFAVAGLVWLIGTLAIIIALIIVYAATKREIRDAELLKDNVFISEKVDGPAVYGIIRPRIILPPSYTERGLKYVLQHERTHIRRGDNLWRLLGFLAAEIHWFNPLCWLFLKEFLSDLELACDEKAVSGYNVEERKEYAKTLLDHAQSKSVFASAFGGSKVRTRIENVLSYKQMTVLSATGFTILLIAIIFTLITNAG